MNMTLNIFNCSLPDKTQINQMLSSRHDSNQLTKAIRTADVKDDGTGGDESRRKPSAHGGKPKEGQLKDDEGSRSKPQPKAKAGAEKKPQPKAKAGAKKTECLRKEQLRRKRPPRRSRKYFC